MNMKCEKHGCEMYSHHVMTALRCPVCVAEESSFLSCYDTADEVLQELRRLHAEGGPPDFDRAMELIAGLDLYLQQGGSPPEDWEKSFPCKTTGEGTAHLGPFTTVRACVDCGVLISGGPTRCMYCAEILESKKVEPAP